MTLEIEKLTAEIEAMAQGAYQRQQEDDRFLEWLLARLHQYATAWDEIELAMDVTQRSVDMKWYRGARPLHRHEPLDQPVAAPPPPSTATLVASDGSQIVPNRHAPYLYALINVGTITYFHGRGQAPLQGTTPILSYPGNDEEDEGFADRAPLVGLRRDLAEIETLVSTAAKHCDGQCETLALLDQRLLYWPVTGEEEGKRVLDGWRNAMKRAYEEKVLLAGYIDRPGKRSLLTFLRSLDALKPDFKPQSLIRQDYGPGLDDVALIRRILTEPGQRSAVFRDVSHHNEEFRAHHANNEVCFFYLRAGAGSRQIARVDIPLWVAVDPQKVAVVHALVYNQCEIMGNYPYVLARADELAVIGFRDKENLDILIENAMARYGINRFATAKQSSKDVARAGRTRHGI